MELNATTSKPPPINSAQTTQPKPAQYVEQKQPTGATWNFNSFAVDLYAQHTQPVGIPTITVGEYYAERNLPEKFNTYANAVGEEKVKAKKVLERTIRTAVQKWLLENHQLGNVTTFGEWLSGWHDIGYTFTTAVNGNVKVTLYACDQTWTQGYTRKPIQTLVINKNHLFT